MRIKLAMIAVACLAMASCKKDRVCECVTQQGNSADKHTERITFKDTGLRTASNACVHSKEEWSFGDTTIVVDVYCELK